PPTRIDTLSLHDALPISDFLPAIAYPYTAPLFVIQFFDQLQIAVRWIRSQQIFILKSYQQTVVRQPVRFIVHSKVIIANACQFMQDIALHIQDDNAIISVRIDQYSCIIKRNISYIIRVVSKAWHKIEFPLDLPVGCIDYAKAIAIVRTRFARGHQSILAIAAY